MYLQFHGAAGGVTGSLHRVHVDGVDILLDCGLFQGHRAETTRLNREPPTMVKNPQDSKFSPARERPEVAATTDTKYREYLAASLVVLVDADLADVCHASAKSLVATRSRRNEPTRDERSERFHVFHRPAHKK